VKVKRAPVKAGTSKATFDDRRVSAKPLSGKKVVANIDYTPAGEVIVRARAGGGSAGVECRGADDGAGIPADRLEKVFDKLETDPDKRSGLGLGHAIVKQFVEAHCGRVFVESELGRGSTFRFAIP
jgi:signal transduction histidine kinase